ncbi:MAG: LysR family transcriptional regulator [Myxococcota bacterium]
MATKKRRPESAHLRVRLRVATPGGIALGPGRVDLLEQIAETGSIVEAARHLEMSYMRAWTLIRDTNAAFREPLIVAERGGRKGGGAALTETGRKVLELYRAMEGDALHAMRSDWSTLRRLLAAPPEP